MTRPTAAELRAQAWLDYRDAAGWCRLQPSAKSELAFQLARCALLILQSDSR